MIAILSREVARALLFLDSSHPVVSSYQVGRPWVDLAWYLSIDSLVMTVVAVVAAVIHKSKDSLIKRRAVFLRVDV